jgi:hypothetical protein
MRAGREEPLEPVQIDGVIEHHELAVLALLTTGTEIGSSS